ncbi:MULTISPECIES: HlyD family secretion protein [unclassified Rhizobium]|uniref:HlyD family secretion protein n=1 Tax=unclassified Rhizobium TaxID=2613769 RepID=UPI001AD9BAA2|nr:MULTISPECIES: HlyD family secretion protein [unclassified Rhizobium]MBO9102382.1 HlyD family secretion protein [Rhizobium sp. L58/93]MBO9136712.1 HlyD family secretion protein [Rhizobium sp. B209b/85]MBO9172429.1 HlyD family secretion protein [Rhizobium sp. L245/93]MBO9186523.1 HlyD family secretion protein [Rhizobium sp. E27B/91]QXZ86089.1 HlyD family secretion protein [Rhizobium sp. K1/93]
MRVEKESDVSEEQAADLSTPTKSPEERRRIKRILLIVALVAVVGGSIWFFNYWTVGRFLQSTNDAFLQADQTAVSPKVQGYVEHLYVVANQRVAVGDKLLKIRPQDYQAKVAQAQAGVESSKANLIRAQAEAKQQISSVGQAEAQLLSAKAQAQFAQSQVDRYQSLGRSGATSNEQIANYTSQRDQQAAQVKVSEASLDSANEAINTTGAAVKQSEAAVRQSEAQLATTQLDLNATEITAPITGVVGDKSVTVGQYVSVGTRLMTLVPVNDIYLVANFKETQVELMRVGQPALISVDAISSGALDGEVESFSPGTGAQFALIPTENATGNFTKIVQRIPVRIKIKANANTRKLLTPGLSVSVEVDTRGSRHEKDEAVEVGQ